MVRDQFREEAVIEKIQLARCNRGYEEQRHSALARIVDASDSQANGRHEKNRIRHLIVVMHHVHVGEYEEWRHETDKRTGRCNESAPGSEGDAQHHKTQQGYRSKRIRYYPYADGVEPEIGAEPLLEIAEIPI